MSKILVYKLKHLLIDNVRKGLDVYKWITSAQQTNRGGWIYFRGKIDN